MGWLTIHVDRQTGLWVSQTDNGWLQVVNGFYRLTAEPTPSSASRCPTPKQPSGQCLPTPRIAATSPAMATTLQRTGS